jgi:sucrose-6-phosphate hydrolase SacC (GH32 family)
MYYDGDIEVNEHYTNKKIKAHILSDEEMKKIGFNKNYSERTANEKYSPYWFYLKSMPTDDDISFIIYIYKDNSSVEIFTLDEDFGQVYDYQHVLKDNPKHEFALETQKFVEEEMKYLQDNGVIEGHNYGEYI